MEQEAAQFSKRRTIMAKKFSNRSCAIAIVVPLLAVSLISFACTITLGVVGIVVATQGNICQGQRIGVGCIPVEDELSADVNLTAIEANLPLVVEDIRDSQKYLFWLTGATVSGLLFVFVGSFCIWIAAQVVYRVNLQSNAEEDNQSTELLEYDQGVTNDSDETLVYNKKSLMEIEGIEELKREKNDPQNWKKYKQSQASQPIRIEDGLYELVGEYDERLVLKKLGAGALIGFNVCFLCGILSILCLLWSFAIGFNRSKRSEDTVTPFVLANILSGIIAPILFFVSAFVGVNIVDYFTDHKIEAHLMLTRFLPSLKYEVSDKSEHWVISDSLCLDIKKDSTNDCILPQFRKHCGRYFNFCKVCLPTYSTALLSIAVVLNFMISFSYFIDISLVSQVSVDSCSDSNINIQYSCFRAGTLKPVDCTSNNATQTLHCFRFYKLGVNVDFISSTASAFAFYLLTNRIFSGILFVMKISRVSKKDSKRQGNLFVIGGLAFLLMTGILVIVWLSGVTSESITLLAHLDVLNLAQLTMFSLFILIVGLLAREGKWIEKRPARHRVVKFEEHPKSEEHYKSEKHDDNHPATA